MSSTIALSSRSVPRALHVSPRAAVGISLLVVVVWAVWAAYFNTAQFGDNVEQFNWAQSLELGYHKHPPLPSWVLGAVIRAFGPSIYWAYVLATLCLLGTAAFTWLLGRELVGEGVAAAAVVLWGLNMTFSQRVQLYNHNTVLVLCISATAWLAMCATRHREARMRWWLATGVAAAAATLSKYQALVPLAGIVLALGLSGRLGSSSQRHGLAGAVLTMLALCTPHAVWVCQHDFTTLKYASEAIESSGPVERSGFIVSFTANQLRLWSPALLAMLLCAAWQWAVPRDRASLPVENRTAPDFRAWMIGLVWAGVAVLVVMALGAGVSLRNHWGVQSLQFFGIWMAWRWSRRPGFDLTRLVCAALAVHALSLGWYAAEHRDPTAVLTSRRIDTMYPARRLARTAVAHWSETTDCPLRYVAGTVFDAGLVSLYSGGSLEVFDTESATPWVRSEDFHRRGALYVLDEKDAVPPGVTDVIAFRVASAERSAHPAKIIRLGVMRPHEDCV